jgi:hypothetical protein
VTGSREHSNEPSRACKVRGGGISSLIPEELLASQGLSHHCSVRWILKLSGEAFASDGSI